MSREIQLNSWTWVRDSKEKRRPTVAEKLRIYGVPEVNKNSFLIRSCQEF